MGWGTGGEREVGVSLKLGEHSMRRLSQPSQRCWEIQAGWEVTTGSSNVRVAGGLDGSGFRGAAVVEALPGRGFRDRQRGGDRAACGSFSQRWLRGGERAFGAQLLEEQGHQEGRVLFLF